MNSFRLLIWSAAICGAAVFTGCVDTASNQLSPMEQAYVDKDQTFCLSFGLCTLIFA